MKLIITLFIALALIGPFVLIWSANTLFPALQIPYTFQTWLAVLLPSLLLKSNLTLTARKR